VLVFRLVELLDDEAQPIAETCRRVARATADAGLPRPSHVHLRQLVRDLRDRRAAERARHDARRAIAEDVAGRLVLARFVDAYAVADRLDAADRLGRRP
jgi:hypothetical protein